MQQTIVRACVYILTWNVVYNVSLICWEVCTVYWIWANLSYIFKSTDWQASLVHLEQKEWIGKWASQNLQDLYRVIRNRKEIWGKDEPVKIWEGISTAPCTGPSSWPTVRLESMKVNINIIDNRLRSISQATFMPTPTESRPTFRTEAIGADVSRWELRKPISVLPMMNDRGLR